MPDLKLVEVLWKGPYRGIIGGVKGKRIGARFDDPTEEEATVGGFYQLYTDSGQPLYIGMTFQTTVKNRISSNYKTARYLSDRKTFQYYVGSLLNSELRNDEIVYKTVESLLIYSNRFPLNYLDILSPRLESQDIILINRGSIGMLQRVSSGLQYYYDSFKYDEGIHRSEVDRHFQIYKSKIRCK